MVKSNQFILGKLFKHLKKGGIFIIEDLHTSYIQHYLNGESTVDVLNRFKNTGELNSVVITNEDSDYISNNINKIIIKKGKISEIAFLYKK
jgi:hypothetical protein